MHALDAEGAPARLASSSKMTRTSVGNPASTRPRQAALGGHDDARSVAVPGGERTSDQPLVVIGFGCIPAVSVRGVDEVDAGIECGTVPPPRATRRDCGRWTGRMHPIPQS